MYQFLGRVRRGFTRAAVGIAKVRLTQTGEHFLVRLRDVGRSAVWASSERTVESAEQNGFRETLPHIRGFVLTNTV